MPIDRFSNVGTLIAFCPELESLFCSFHSRLDLTDLAMSVRGFCEHHGCDLDEVLGALRREQIDPAAPPPRSSGRRPLPAVRLDADDLDDEVAWRDAAQDCVGDDLTTGDDDPEPDDGSGRGSGVAGPAARRRHRAA